MCTTADPMSAPEALANLQTLAGHLADLDATSMPAEALGQYIRELGPSRRGTYGGAGPDAGRLRRQGRAPG